MAVSIEALYMVIGYLDIGIQQDALSLDKYWQNIYFHERIQLGMLINIYTMTVGLSNSKRLIMVDELYHVFLFVYS